MKADRALYALTIGGSSALLFLVQPVLAKSLLPRFGGSAGVWVCCMLFFQVMLLAGYLYAYGSTKYLDRRAQAVLHVVLLGASLLALPLRPRAWGWANGKDPTWSILELLVVSVGLPYFLLSTTSPLLQSWYAARGARFPYRLFAISNAASLVALLGYPFGIEPLLPVSQQMRWWSWAYGGVAVLAALAAMRSAGGKPLEDRVDLPGTEAHPWRWIALAACASALWLAVANHLSQQVAAIPFLWVLPLGVYLLSFILCFEGSGWYRPLLFRWLLPVAWAAMGWRIASQGSGGLEWEIPVFAGALLICCLFCHGELADSKPDARDGLAFFYLMVALGGALGAVFVGLVAPNLFSTYLELPVGVVGCVVLALALLFGFPGKRLVRLVLMATLAFVLALRYQGADALLNRRNFYGALEVRGEGSGEAARRALYNGRTLHGVQFLDAARRHEATAFYGTESGVGRVLGSGGSGRRVAIIGLGAGTLATYGRRGDVLRFYEINPAVIQVASQYFGFLAESEAETSVVAGDGRLELEREPRGSFDVIVLDAFSDDSIPVHLLTREAFESYFGRLRDGGTLAIHITNRYLELDPLVTGLAGEMGKRVVLIHNQADLSRQVAAADWAVVSGSPLTELAAYGHAPSGRRVRVWTDEFSNLFDVLR